ncbi:MAG: DUF3604 domain-containing protein [Deltaproteobacteria bacterium]|nr:DUF3604 domain-containing protein [Deltaproteobacteria bacterium]
MSVGVARGGEGLAALRSRGADRFTERRLTPLCGKNTWYRGGVTGADEGTAPQECPPNGALQSRSHEKIFDVSLSGGRTVDPKTGKVPAVGNTVDTQTARYTNSIGDAMLFTVWAGPEFDAEHEAFYYARVLEIPTPRWSTFDALELGKPPMSPATIQERAISSALWYSPR